MPNILDSRMVETITGQEVYGPLDWDETSGTVVVYLQGERTTFALDDLETPQGERLAFPES